MKRILYLFFALFLGLPGCSYMDITADKEVVVDMGSITLSPKTDSALFYYYQGERIPLAERKDLIALQFINSETKFISSGWLSKEIVYKNNK